MKEYSIKPKFVPDLAATFRNWLKKQPIKWIKESDSGTIVKKFKRNQQLEQTIDSLKLACVELIRQYIKRHDEGLEKKKKAYANKHRFF